MTGFYDLIFGSISKIFFGGGNWFSVCRSQLIRFCEGVNPEFITSEPYVLCTILSMILFFILVYLFIRVLQQIFGIIFKIIGGLF